MDTALPQITEMDDIIRTVWGADQWNSRAQTADLGHRLSGVCGGGGVGVCEYDFIRIVCGGDLWNSRV